MPDISQINTGQAIYDIKDSTARGIATTQNPGRVKPDSSTTSVDANGTLSVVNPVVITNNDTSAPSNTNALWVYPA